MGKEEDKVKDFVARVKEKFVPAKVIIFGSRANGTAWKRSDYDFIIISERFEGMHWLDRISAVIALWDVYKDIDVLPYTPSEFEFKIKNSSIVRSAMKNKKVL